MSDTDAAIDARAAADTGDDIQLTDVMLAMDVVDTLRHQESLVARELDAEAREAELIARVRRMYSSQGIEVSDRTIADGVKALREQRFEYVPPPGGLVTGLLRAWVNRRRLGKRLLAVVGVVCLTWAGWFGFVTQPNRRARVVDAQKLNNSVEEAAREALALGERRQRLEGALDDASRNAPRGDAASLFEINRQDAESALNTAAQLLTSAVPLSQTASFTSDNLAELGDAASSQLERQQVLLGQATEALDDAAASLSALGRLRTFPGEMVALRTEATQIARDTRARTLADDHYRDGSAALRRNDLAAAEAANAELRRLVEVLKQEYTLTIVSRPDERSGVWRYPEGNTNARNYYLIVEAIDRNGNRLEVPVTSEEDGQVLRSVTVWGLRVEQAVYERIASDKQDDGIIQDNVFGVKRRGFVAPDYRITTTGGAITSWADQ